jgi:two-component system response regulator AtoC
MLEYDWPGNVRELQNAVERAFVLAESDVIHHYHLPESMQNARTAGFAASIDLFEAVAAYERDLICHTLRTTRGNRNQAAKLLLISERTLAYKVRKHGIDHANFRER